MKNLSIIGMPQDIGSAWRGVDMGPMALRAAGLHRELKALGWTVSDLGNLECVSMDAAEECAFGPRSKRRDWVQRNCALLRDVVAGVVRQGGFPLVLGGDHSQTMGTLAGLKEGGAGEMGVLYVDAHADFNTPETSPTGNIHGMPLAVACGRGDPELLAMARAPSVREEAVVLFGVRDVDPCEKDNLRASRVRVFSMNEITERGFATCLREALDLLSEQAPRFHLSFDVDCLDPSTASGTGYSIPGGFSSREALFLMEKAHDTGCLASLELVEVNPALDHDNQTARLAVELIVRALGKKTV